MVSRADLAEVWFRQVPRPASSAARGSEGNPRFSLEAAERKPAAPVRLASRRDETASARSDAGRADRMGTARAESAAAEAAKTEAVKTEAARTRTAKADATESWRTGASPENRAQSASARGKPLPSGHAREGTDTASARAPGAAASASPRPAEGKAPQGAVEGAMEGAVQEAAAEGAAAEEAGAVVLSEDETRAQDETDSAAPGAVDPAALPSPPSTLPPHIPAPAATSPTGVAVGEGVIGEGKAVAGGPGEAAATGQAAKADATEASASAAGTAGFETALAGTQSAPAPAPTGAAPALTPPGHNGLGAAQGTQAAQATDAAAAPQPATPPIPLGAVPMTIGLRSLSGMNRFAIRLDPVELGRIDVSLDLDKAGGKARAHLVVDRPETLALLQRDAGSLQQALAQAGFEVGAEAGGIDLSLRGETGSQGGRDGESAPRGGADRGPGGRDDGPAPLDSASLDPASLRRLRAVSGLDIRI